jgi:hypothetical protein
VRERERERERVRESERGRRGAASNTGSKRLEFGGVEVEQSKK